MIKTPRNGRRPAGEWAHLFKESNPAAEVYNDRRQKSLPKRLTPEQARAKIEAAKKKQS